MWGTVEASMPRGNVARRLRFTVRRLAGVALIFHLGSYEWLLVWLLVGFIAFFAAMTALQFVVVLTVYPETKGIALEEMDKRLAMH
jgi:hypothetical protein